MLKRLAAFSLVLLFAGNALAGAFACGQGDRSSAVEMACCVLAKSAGASPAAVMCCEVVCGESGGTSGTQSEDAVRLRVPALPVAPHPAASFDQLLASSLRPLTRPADVSLLGPTPPDLYLQNSSFLI